MCLAHAHPADRAGVGAPCLSKPVCFSRVGIIYPPGQALRCDHHLGGVFPRRNLSPGSVWGMGHLRVLAHLAGMAGLECSRGGQADPPHPAPTARKPASGFSPRASRVFSSRHAEAWPLNTTPYSFWGKVYNEAWLIKS